MDPALPEARRPSPLAIPNPAARSAALGQGRHSRREDAEIHVAGVIRLNTGAVPMTSVRLGIIRSCTLPRAGALTGARSRYVRTLFVRGLTVLAVLFAAHFALAQDTGSIRGKVTDSSGALIFGAVVRVTGADGNSHVTITNAQGAFQISSLASGNYTVKISANGLADWSASNVPASVSPESKPLLAVMRVAPTVTSVTVRLRPQEVAQAQLNQEVKQRVLGVLPNYYVAYESNAAPLSPKQKLHLGMKVLLDPATLTAVGVTAAIQQERNSYYQYGHGAEGFAKRYGAEYATAADAVLITSVLADSVLHQDPRYFYDGKGTIRQRAWYAVESAFRAKGDNGKWQPPYAGLIGSIAAAEIAQTYHPDPRTQYTLIGRALMFRFAGMIGMNLFQELFLKKLTTHTPADNSAASVTVLREGTAVRLIAVEGFGTSAATAGQNVTFVLAQDLTQNGKVLAHAGDVASGVVTQVQRGPGNTSGGATSVALQQVTLRAGKVSVPLRSNQVRGAAAPVQYKKLPGSGKVEVTLYVAKDVAFPQNQ